MQEVTFTLQTNTPLFLAGADPSVAEIRPPSFRGPMRYWYRALVGGLAGTDDEGLKKTINAESAVFGATDSGSVLRIRTGEASKEFKSYRKTSSSRDDVNGIDYLLWSMARSGNPNKGNLKEARLYFPAKIDFTVTLFALETQSEAFQNGLAAFWLLTHLGGIGSRSHRCAGSIQVIETDFQPEGPKVSLPFGVPQTVQTLDAQITQGIQIARRLSGIKAETESVANFDALTSTACKIWIVQDTNKPWTSADQAMRDIGESLQDYRSSIKPIERRRIFGLPLMGVDNRSRRTSPLALRITRLQGGQFVGVVVLFKTRVDTVQDHFTPASYDIIERWISKDFPQALEVKL